jgi:hypothetical protein
VAVAYTDTEVRLCRAAAKAGIKYVMPNHWGSDLSNPTLIAEMYAGQYNHSKWDAFAEAGLAWTALACGFWYEHSMVVPTLFGFDLRGKEVTFYDDGATKINISTWDLCGEAVAKFLSLPIFPRDEDDKSVTMSRWFNTVLCVADFTISQKDIFASVLRVCGDDEKDWKVSYEPAEERVKKGRELMAAGGPNARAGFGMQMYARAFYANGDGNFGAKHGLANEVLGLKAGDLDEHTRNAKRMIQEGWSYHT